MSTSAEMTLVRADSDLLILPASLRCRLYGKKCVGAMLALAKQKNRCPTSKDGHVRTVEGFMKTDCGNETCVLVTIERVAVTMVQMLKM